VSKIVVPVKLAPDHQVNSDLVATLRACNGAANHVSDVAWNRRIFRKYDLQQVSYGEVRSIYGLGAQAAVRCIKKVADAYNSGDPKFRRTRQRTFRWDSAQPFDARNLAWNVPGRTVSIWTINGRAKTVPFVCADWQAELLTSCPIGESDLVSRNGALYLYATVDVEDEPLNESPTGWLGVGNCCQISARYIAYVRSSDTLNR